MHFLFGLDVGHLFILVRWRNLRRVLVLSRSREHALGAFLLGRVRLCQRSLLRVRLCLLQIRRGLLPDAGPQISALHAEEQLLHFVHQQLRVGPQRE